MNKIKDKLLVVTVCLFVLSLSLYAMLKRSDEYSYSERRYLNQFPDLNISEILNGDYMENFENYIQDQFPFRDKFRTLKANCAYYVFNKLENNDIYIKDGYLSKMEYPYNDYMGSYMCDLINKIKDTYMSEDNRIYYSIVPDKNYYLSDNSLLLSMDYHSLEKTMNSKLDNMQYISLFDKLDINDYYYTDTHWKQENLEGIADYILESMGNKPIYDYTKMLGTDEFAGVYLGQSALDVSKESLYYLYNDNMKDYIVKSYSNGEKEISLYTEDKLSSKDAYEFYLNGSEALLTIENKNSTSDKELIVFRDSFSSSLAPLLCESYKKVTLVDLRYMNSSTISSYIEFNNQDVLFIYSTLVINSSTSLK